MRDQPRRRTRSSTKTNCLKRSNWNPQDILATWGHSKAAHQTVVGFALETDEGTASAQSKLERKKADFIVLNSTSVPGAGFETDTNQVTIFEKGGNSHKFELKSKAEVAEDIVRTLLNSFDS